MKAFVIFDIDGVLRDVSGSYRRALADTVEYFTHNKFRPDMLNIDELKSEGIWNNDWEASQELIYRYFESEGKNRDKINLNYQEIVAFFQYRYRGSDPINWNGYITTEPLLVNKEYFSELTANNIGWGFFSGATRGSAEYILQKRIGLENPILIAMEDAPSKPDPTGLFLAVKCLEESQKISDLIPVFYLGDTVADIQTVINAQAIQPQRQWIAVGILPPHVLSDLEIKNNYTKMLQKTGASFVLNNVTELMKYI